MRVVNLALLSFTAVTVLSCGFSVSKVSNLADSSNSPGNADSPKSPTKRSVTVTNAVCSSATLSWSSGGTKTYTVKYGTTSGVYNVTYATSATSPVSLSGLTAGTTYYFQITENENETIDSFAEVIVKPEIPAGGPSLITLPSTAMYSSVAFSGDPSASAATGGGAFTLQLSGVAAGNSIDNTTSYLAWDGGWYNGGLMNAPSPTVPIYSTYSSSFPAGDQPLYGNNFKMINYILNHKQGTIEDVQNAIYMTMVNFISPISTLSPEAKAMVGDAFLNPTYTPNACGVMAVYFQINPGDLDTNAADGGNVFSNLFIEVPVPRQ